MFTGHGILIIKCTLSPLASSPFARFQARWLVSWDQKESSHWMNRTQCYSKKKEHAQGWMRLQDSMTSRLCNPTNVQSFLIEPYSNDILLRCLHNSKIKPAQLLNDKLQHACNVSTPPRLEWLWHTSIQLSLSAEHNIVTCKKINCNEYQHLEGRGNYIIESHFQCTGIVIKQLTGFSLSHFYCCDTHRPNVTL